MFRYAFLAAQSAPADAKPKAADFLPVVEATAAAAAADATALCAPLDGARR
ncbi:hypothetical protein [Streptomyces albipurpureus]|uniref:Uncharacterized protein n=1 Tax=Streptomyces albipurpureus TaxID=2897419 RepID=A0ABT0UVE5_9ACTN|nr:hypothetical protein [Streptomyces sp. CWNU-1]MCM2391615.1 hypothetical protein [Streptomyces sp. CWNU-1]